MDLQLRFVHRLGETGRSMCIRMVNRVAGRRLQLGYTGLDECGKALVYMPANHVSEYPIHIEVLDLRPEEQPDRLILCVQAYGTQIKKFVFAGARQNGKYVPMSENDLRQVFLGNEANAQFPAEYILG